MKLYDKTFEILVNSFIPYWNKRSQFWDIHCIDIDARSKWIKVKDLKWKLSTETDFRLLSNKIPLWNILQTTGEIDFYLQPADRLEIFFNNLFFPIYYLSLPPTTVHHNSLSRTPLCYIVASLVFHNLSSVSFPRNSPNFICFIYPPPPLSIFFLKVQSSFSFEPCPSPIYFFSLSLPPLSPLSYSPPEQQAWKLGKLRRHCTPRVQWLMLLQRNLKSSNPFMPL